MSNLRNEINIKPVRTTFHHNKRKQFRNPAQTLPAQPIHRLELRLLTHPLVLNHAILIAKSEGYTNHDFGPTLFSKARANAA